MIKLCLLLHGSKFVRFSRVVVACRHVWRRQATTAWSLISSGWFSLSRRFYHHPSLGCLRPLLVQHYPWPFEPRIFMVRFLSFMYKIFSDISFMCRTFTEIQSRRSISVLLLEQVRTWVGRRLGWGGDSLGWWTSDFTLGLVNVWGGECLGGERLTIVNSINLVRFSNWHVSGCPLSRI